MRVPLRWLEEWIPLPDSGRELEERLTLAGLEIEGVERKGPDLSIFQVARVAECKPHPNADRLSVCSVELGGGEVVEVVCGAPNVAAGQKVVVARPGSSLPDGTKLKKAKIRGVLTIHGVSKDVVLETEYLGKGKDPWGNERYGFHAETSINRKDFGMAWNEVLEAGGLLVGDEVEIILDIEAVPVA